MTTNPKLAEFQRDRLRQARHRRQWTMKELAVRVGLTRQAISSFERGDSSPSPRTLRELARQLEVPENFLTAPFRPGENSLQSAITYRSLAASTARARNQAKVYLEWASSLVACLSEYVQLPPVHLPEFSIDDCLALRDDVPDEYAASTRRFFRLGDGPISNLTLLMENHGVVVLYAPLEKGIEGVSAWYCGRPFIVVSSNSSAVRARFDVAHELAHLVLHREAAQEDLEQRSTLKVVEQAAHRFASSFLLPESTFAAEVYGLDIESLVGLKKRWLVSIQAMIMRLYSIGLIGEHKKIRMFQSLSSRNLRKREPLDDVLIPERSRMFQRVLELLDKEGIARVTDVLTSARLPENFLTQAMNLDLSETISSDGNIIPFPSKF